MSREFSVEDANVYIQRVFAEEVDRQVRAYLVGAKGTDWVQQFERLVDENKRLREEIEALTHEGRQGELEQANVGLAEENARLRACARSWRG